MFAMAAAMVFAVSSCKKSAGDAKGADSAAAKTEAAAPEKKETPASKFNLSGDALKIAEQQEEMLVKLEATKTMEEFEAVGKEYDPIFTELEKTFKEKPELEKELEEWGKDWKARFEKLTEDKVKQFIGDK